MKDKNTVIGWLLIALVFVGFMMYNSKDAEKRAAAIKKQQAIEALAQQKSDSIAKIEAQKQAEKELAEMSDSTNALFKARQGSAGTTVIQNELLKLTISNKGGQLERAELLDPTYKNQQGGNVVLFDAKESNMQFVFEGKEDNIISDEFFFTPKEVSKDAVTMSLPVGSGSIDISYSLVPNSYLVNMNVQANGLKGYFPAKADKFTISWNEKMRQQEKGYAFENRYSTITYRSTDNDTDELSSAGADKEKDGEDFDEKLNWLAFKTQFFSQILIPEEAFDVEKMSSKQLKEVKGDVAVKYLKNLQTDVTTNFDPSGKNPTNMKMYLGPNKFQTLQENEKMLGEDRDLDLQSIVYLGWPIIRWINRFVFIYLFDWLTGWGLNMGIVLLLITLIVKFAVYPLMKKSYLSSANMRVLRPKVDAINAKYTKPEDAMIKQQETMKLYSEYGVSPMGGCLPMLIQMPIWIALFNFIPNAIELRGQSFLWAKDLSAYDDVIRWGTNIWGIGDHISIFCVLWCLSTVVNTWISMRQQQYSMTPEQEQSMKMMKWMSYLMPLIFFFSFNNYASGLTYYYFISGLISIIMMWYLRKTTDDAKLLAKLEERHKKNKSNPKKTTSMMERLQKMAEQQQEVLRQQQEEQAKKHGKK